MGMGAIKGSSEGKKRREKRKKILLTNEQNKAENLIEKFFFLSLSNYLDAPTDKGSKVLPHWKGQERRSEIAIRFYIFEYRSNVPPLPIKWLKINLSKTQTKINLTDNWKIPPFTGKKAKIKRIENKEY